MGLDIGKTENAVVTADLKSNMAAKLIKKAAVMEF